ncbi:MAG: methylenetetrahydrofolate reductase, partial [Pseudomonadota bacterium]
RREDPSPFVDSIEKNQLQEVLIVQGDAPQDMSHRVYPNTSVDLIRLFKRYFPEVKVYAALDAYRAGLRDEYEYIQRKLEAGADGFFTQPFFDVRLLEVYADFLQEQKIFWGVSPVMTERSRNYWEARNQVIFPSDFEPTLEWNIAFAKKVLAYADAQDFDVYLMPIKVNIEKYLSGIFD